MKWRYRFTTREEKKSTGAWWKREMVGAYAPSLHVGPEGIEAVPRQGP